MFQSLFFWMALWKLSRRDVWFLCGFVSILVFLDGALKDLGENRRVLGGYVSILVFLDGALKDLGENRRVLGGYVSILVFLDGALKACFGIIVSYTFRSVSILVFLDGALKVEVWLSGEVCEEVSILVFLDGALKGW